MCVLNRDEEVRTEGGGAKDPAVSRVGGGQTTVGGNRAGVHLVHATIRERNFWSTHLLYRDHADVRDEISPRHVLVFRLDRLESFHGFIQPRVEGSWPPLAPSPRV